MCLGAEVGTSGGRADMKGIFHGLRDARASGRSGGWAGQDGEGVASGMHPPESVLDERTTARAVGSVDLEYIAEQV